MLYAHVCSCMLMYAHVCSMGKKVLLISERTGWMKVREFAEAFAQAFAHAKEAAAEPSSVLRHRHSMGSHYPKYRLVLLDFSQAHDKVKKIIIWITIILFFMRMTIGCKLVVGCSCMLDVCSCMLDVITIVPHDLGRRTIIIFLRTWRKIKREWHPECHIFSC